VDSLRIQLPNWPLPNAGQGCFDLRLLRQAGEVFGVLDVLMRLREKQRELVFCRLEDAEGAILSAIYNLNILHRAPC
jgi:hypothetical protein